MWQMAEGCPVRAAGLACTQRLRAVTSVSANPNRAECLPRRVLRITHRAARGHGWGDPVADRHLLMERNPNMVRVYSEASASLKRIWKHTPCL